MRELKTAGKALQKIVDDGVVEDGKERNLSCSKHLRRRLRPRLRRLRSLRLRSLRLRRLRLLERGSLFGRRIQYYKLQGSSFIVFFCAIIFNLIYTNLLIL